MSWNAEQFQDDLAELLKAFNSAFLSDTEKYLRNPKGERKKLLQALSSLDVVKVQKSLDEIILKIELKLRNQCHQCMIINSYLEKDMITISNNYFYTGCVRSKVIADVNSAVSQLNNLVTLARSHLEVLNANSGLSGALKGLFTGYANPMDGVAHAFGKGSMQIEIRLSTQEFNTTALLMGQNIDAISNYLKVIVLETWNSFGAYLEENNK